MLFSRRELLASSLFGGFLTPFFGNKEREEEKENPDELPILICNTGIYGKPFYPSQAGLLEKGKHISDLFKDIKDREIVEVYYGEAEKRESLIWVPYNFAFRETAVNPLRYCSGEMILEEFIVIKDENHLYGRSPFNKFYEVKANKNTRWTNAEEYEKEVFEA